MSALEDTEETKSTNRKVVNVQLYFNVLNLKKYCDSSVEPSTVRVLRSRTVPKDNLRKGKHLPQLKCIVLTNLFYSACHSVAELE